MVDDARPELVLGEFFNIGIGPMMYSYSLDITPL